MRWEVVNYNPQQPTIKVISNGKDFYLHSRYNPLKEAQNIAANFKKESNCKKLFIIGMGAGYHIHQLLLKYPYIDIEVWDLNLNFSKWTEEHFPLVQKVTSDSRVSYKYSENLKYIKDHLFKGIMNSSNAYYIHKPSLELISDELVEIKLWLKQIRLFQTSYENQKDMMFKNFIANLKDNPKGIDGFINFYKDKPSILISAGPSLTKQLSTIKKITESNKVIIGCVGTALIPLLKSGIQPDFVMISDANEIIAKQIESNEVQNFPLFYLSTASNKAVRLYKGPKFIVWQREYNLAEEQANKRKEPLVSTGGSVATCLLDLLVEMGVKSVALVGQDLAFTNNCSHAEDTIAQKNVHLSESLIKVDNYDQNNSVLTSLNLYAYKTWFEEYALFNKKTVHLWNCTEGGAYIKGWKHEKLLTYFDDIQKNTSIT